MNAKLFAGAAAISFLLLALFASPVSAGTQVFWSQTIEFDAGTKSHYNDVHALETRSDNPGIPQNRLMPASTWGDTFTNDSTDALTWKWTNTTGCATEGTAVIAHGIQTYAGQNVELWDGAMVFHHGAAKDVQNTTRATTGPVAGYAGDFQYSWEGLQYVDWENDDAAMVNVWGENLTIALTTRPDYWCGAWTNTSLSGVYAVGLTFLGSILFFGNDGVAVQPFTVANGVFTYCAPAVIAAPFNNYLTLTTFTRVAGSWLFRVEGSVFPSCYTGQAGPLYAVVSWSSNTTNHDGGYTILRGAWSNYYTNNPLDEQQGTYLSQSVALSAQNWTSPVFGDNTQMALTWRLDIGGIGGLSRYTLSTLKLLSNTGTVLELFAIGINDVVPAGGIAQEIASFSTPAKGPFKFYFEFGGGNAHDPVWIARVYISISDSTAGGGGGGGGGGAVPLKGLGWFVDFGFICGILGLVVFTFLMIMYRYRRKDG